MKVKGKFLRYGVISHRNIFFTCKNSLVILLQIYRLLVLVVKKRPQYRRHSIFSILPLDDDDDEDEQDEDGNNYSYDITSSRYTQRRSTGYPGLQNASSSSDGTLELFDKDSTAKEKGRISVKFQDKDTNFSQRSEQPCQVHQN